MGIDMKLFDYADAYLRESDWKDLAMIKFCLFAMGLLMGMALPKKARLPAACVAMFVFVITYVPLILKFFAVAKDYSKEIEL